MTRVHVVELYISNCILVKVRLELCIQGRFVSEHIYVESTTAADHMWNDAFWKSKFTLKLRRVNLNGEVGCGGGAKIGFPQIFS